MPERSEFIAVLQKNLPELSQYLAPDLARIFMTYCRTVQTWERVGQHKGHHGKHQELRELADKSIREFAEHWGWHVVISRTDPSCPLRLILPNGPSNHSLGGYCVPCWGE